MFTHNAFLFCTFLAHAFPCIAFLFFIVFLRFSPVVFFFFSPLDFLTMAPKKSTHLENLISRHGSLSSSSLPSLPARQVP